MKKILFALVCLLSLSTAAQASPLTFTAVLSGPNENPVNASPGIGFATVTIDPVTHLMTLDVTFSGLTGTTIASHIHCCITVPNGTAGVATTTPTFAGFPLGVTSGTFLNTLNMTLASSYNPAYVTANGGTTATAEAALFAGIIAGTSYLNIHTSTFSGGEIRGFLTPAAVPEPGTLALMGLGLGLVAVRRFRK